MFGRREHRHIRINLREDLRFNLFAMGFKLIGVCETLAQFDGLFVIDCPVNNGLDFRNRGSTTRIDKKRDIKSFTRIVKHVVCSGSDREAVGF